MSAKIDNRRPDSIAAAISEYDEDAVPAAETREPATTGAIADELGVDRGQLLRYARHHPNPTAAALLGWAGADPALAADVEEWLDAYGRSAADRWEVSGE